MTFYIAAYDTEAPKCLDACRAIVEMHKRHRMPATFFIVGKMLQADPDEYRRLLDDELFEIASHTYSHRMLRDNPFCGKQIGPADLREEIFRGKEEVEKTFPGRKCIGLRPGCSFEDGLKGAPDVLKLVSEAGYEYVSSQAWGPDFTLPAPLNQAFTYAQDGYPNLTEYPCHGWHDNVLKGTTKWPTPKRMLAFPPLFPQAVPDGFVKTPREEFQVNNKFFIDLAIREKAGYVSLIWHPWSLMKFDPKMEMLDITFRYVKEQALGTLTFEQMHRRAKG
ncbi:MAG: polysaccharide deacetylase family protein [Planctomycetes bacterium]|nr:polysaccharide deacetylase family protein [Planctomycetota bacterium]